MIYRNFPLNKNSVHLHDILLNKKYQMQHENFIDKMMHSINTSDKSNEFNEESILKHMKRDCPIWYHLLALKRSKNEIQTVTKLNCPGFLTNFLNEKEQQITIYQNDPVYAFLQSQSEINNDEQCFSIDSTTFMLNQMFAHRHGTNLIGKLLHARNDTILMISLVDERLETLFPQSILDILQDNTRTIQKNLNKNDIQTDTDGKEEKVDREKPAKDVTPAKNDDDIDGKDEESLVSADGLAMLKIDNELYEQVLQIWSKDQLSETERFIELIGTIVQFAHSETVKNDVLIQATKIANHLFELHQTDELKYIVNMEEKFWEAFTTPVLQYLYSKYCMCISMIDRKGKFHLEVVKKETRDKSMDESIFGMDAKSKRHVKVFDNLNAKISGKKCCNCHKKLKSGVHICLGCNIVRYCTINCQKAHWKFHQYFCISAGSRNLTMKRI